MAAADSPGHCLVPVRLLWGSDKRWLVVCLWRLSGARSPDPKTLSPRGLLWLLLQWLDTQTEEEDGQRATIFLQTDTREVGGGILGRNDSVEKEKGTEEVESCNFISFCSCRVSLVDWNELFSSCWLGLWVVGWQGGDDDWNVGQGSIVHRKELKHVLLSNN